LDKPSKVLIVGSGPIVIGQAAEFDYAGTQACKAMREEGVISVLVNSNPATIMTDAGVADAVYIEPLTVDVLTRIIERERPDGLLPTLGGQTGLNLAVALAKSGVLDQYGVRLLGTPLETIHKAEDRELFRDMLRSIGEPFPDSEIVTSLDGARQAVERIGLPAVIRPAYTLGGSGGGIAYSPEDLDRIAAGGMAQSPIGQVLIEKCLLGWKEIEYEVMRDGADTCLTICNMENLDPMGVHTGDSIVVAPSQTLSDKEYQMLRSASLRIIRELGIEGGCNVQLALAPRTELAEWQVPPDDGDPPYYVIEVNPRVSRSSALASKATGYPIARVAAKIAVGKKLHEIANAVTQKTTAAFEPALDYVVVKIPRWPFDKFPLADRQLGTQMKATGEVMAIDRTFEAALQKAIRSLEIGRRSLLWEDPSWQAERFCEDPIPATDERIWRLMAALRRDADPMLVAAKTGIDPWFLAKLGNIVAVERRLLSEELTRDLLLEAKRTGFSDDQIAALADSLPARVRQLRVQWKIKPVYKLVDTCAGEFEAVTPYFYSAYEDENEAPAIESQKALVIGSGPIRIGQGIEFDYCSVHAAWALQKAGFGAIIVNSNPETVSTDFDTSDRLYFEPLDEESIRDILDNETPSATNGTPPSIVQFGGQTAVNLAAPLSLAVMPILGSSAETIDMAEDRKRFEEFLSRLGIPQPPGAAITTIEEALNTAQTIGYPVLVRPSYVLGGRAMEICQNASELIRYVEQAAEAGPGKPVLIDKYLEGREVEVDAVCDGRDVLIPGIMEHIERAGVHSGDSLAVYPPISLSQDEIDTVVDYTKRIGVALHVHGLMNVQYVIAGSDEDRAVYVLEVNPRSSRTVPIISKVTGVPLVQLATFAAIGKSLAEQGYTGGLSPVPPLVAVKAPAFSMSKLGGVDTYLGPEMKSTGEVMGIDRAFEPALWKALLAAELSLPERGAILLSIADQHKSEALPIVHRLSSAGYTLYATEGTAAMLRAMGHKVQEVPKRLSEGHPNVVDVIQDGTVDAVINISEGRMTGTLRDGFHIRRAAAERRIPCFTSLDTARVAVDAMASGDKSYSVEPMSVYLTGHD
jgi:carbamoyl-phosphate synthase large subunit